MVELNNTVSAEYMVVLFKSKATVEYVKNTLKGKIKLFGREMKIEPLTELPLALTGE